MAVVAESGKPELKGIIRIVGKDLKGTDTVYSALPKIRGVGRNIGTILSKVVEDKLKIKRETNVGYLSEDELLKIEGVLKDPVKYGVPKYLLNRSSDPETGEVKHLVGADLNFANRQDVEFEKNARTWKGWRHSLGQKVRGQRTRTTGRKGMSVGVMKKALKEQKAKAAAPKAAAGGKADKK
jgi:small subunit ribosomal protein S13